MDLRDLVLLLEAPYAAFMNTPGVAAGDVLRAGLSEAWPSDYWAGLAVGWLEKGAPMDAEASLLLNAVVQRRHFSQAVRHRAFALTRRAERRGNNAT